MIQEINSLTKRLREMRSNLEYLIEERNAAGTGQNYFCDATNEIAAIIQKKLAHTEAELAKYKAANLGKNPCIGCAGLCKGDGECAYLWAKELMQAKERAEAELAEFTEGSVTAVRREPPG